MIRSTRLRLSALAAAALVTWLSLDGPIWPAGAAATAAPVTAWWTTANLGHGLAAPAALFGASGKQLPVEGSNALPPVSAVSTAPLSSIAVAAIRWRLSPGEVASSLSLTIAGSPPPFLAVQACRATSSFAAVSGGPYADVPKYSCAHAIDGVVKSGRLTFAGIGKLASGNSLSVLLLPGPLDRVVFAPPTVSSLAVTASSVPRQKRPCACLPKGGGAGGSGHSPGGVTGPGPLPAISPPPAQVGPAPTAPPPVVAGPTGGSTQAAALSQSLPRWHRWLAAAVIALEVLVFAATRRSTGRDPNPGRGIGRFIAQRDTSPIRL